MVAGEQEVIYKRRIGEVSSRTLILRARAYIYMILGYWYWVVLAALPLAYMNYSSTIKILPTYPAKTSILVKTGLPSKEDKVMTQTFSVVAGSRKALEITLMKNSFLRGKPDLLINHYLATYRKFYPDQIPSQFLEDFRFESDNPIEFDETERKVYAFVISRLTNRVAGQIDGVVSISNNDKLGFIFLKIATPMEELSILFLDKLYETFEGLYLKNIVHAEQGSLVQMRESRDSLKRIFDKSFSSLLKRKDHLKKLLDAKDSTANLSRMARRIQEKEIDVEFLKVQYLDYAKKVKEAEVELNAKAPLIMITEKSLSPIQSIQPSATLAAAKGAFTGAAVMIFLLLLRMIYINILEEDPHPE